MSNSRKVGAAIAVVVIVLNLGNVAKNYNERNHMDMALDECGSEQNIKRVDSKGFECVVEQRK